MTYLPRLEPLELRVVLNGGPIINELLAINNRSLQDYDDDWTDWIEVANTSTSQVNLQGYYLTDDRTDLQKWQVPTETLLDPGEYLVVFASGKDFVAPTGELNTNFQLGGDGEYLALVEPDGATIAWEYDSPLPEGGIGFPSQVEDISYGVGTTTVEVPLVAPDADIEYLVPVSAEQLSPDWTEPDFTDPAGVWTASPGGNGVGFQTDGDELSGLIQTDLSGVMDGENASAFVRAEFEVPSGVTLEDLTLGVRYNDGFVAYLNGTEVARRNAPATPVWNSAATAERDNTEAVQLEEIPLTVGRLLSDFHAIKDNTFMVDLPSGEYDVTIHQGDLTRVRDEMAIFLEDTQVDTVTTQEGEVVTNTYRVEVTDGQLSLRLQDQGGATGRSAINALVIAPVGAIDGFSTVTLDFGSLTSPVQPGAIQIHVGSLYLPEVGHGWSSDDVNGVERALEESNLQLLQAGPNVLAFQGLNVEATSADFLLQFELSGTRLQQDTSRIGYLLGPTPGEPNSTLWAPQMATPAGYSVEGGTFTADFSLVLTSDVPGGVIHYTLDRTVPTAGSARFDPASGISLTETTQVRSIVVAPGYLPSPTASQTYVKLAEDVWDFRSQIPLMVVENLARPFIYNPFTLTDSYWAIFEPEAASGLSSLVNAPELQTRAGVRNRGHSSRSDPKRAYLVEARDEKDQDKDVSPLGMPADSDWILSARHQHDLALMRPDFAFELSNQMGNYAVRTRFVELFVNTDDGEVSLADYVGVYTLMEKIKRGNDRVDVEKLSRNYNAEPLITGGYMLKFDNPLPPGDRGFQHSPGVHLQYVDPKEVGITQPGREPQVEFIQNYLKEMAESLTNPDPLAGYPAFIDVDSWLNIHWLEIFLNDNDSFVNSQYFFNRRNGRVESGPLWDMDRSAGARGGGCCGPEGRPPQGFTSPGIPWFYTVLGDPDYRQGFIDRYQELREDVFQTANLSSILASLAAQITVKAAERNFEKWDDFVPNHGDPPSWLGEVEFMQQWLERRVNWIDKQLIPQPQIVQEGLGGGCRREASPSTSARVMRPSRMAIPAWETNRSPKWSALAGQAAPISNCWTAEGPMILDATSSPLAIPRPSQWICKMAPTT